MSSSSNIALVTFQLAFESRPIFWVRFGYIPIADEFGGTNDGESIEKFLAVLWRGLRYWLYPQQAIETIRKRLGQ
jgi:hypothetical protein